MDKEQQPDNTHTPSAQEILANLERERSATPAPQPTEQAPIGVVSPPNSVEPMQPAVPQPTQSSTFQPISQSSKARHHAQTMLKKRLVVGILGIVVLIGLSTLVISRFNRQSQPTSQTTQDTTTPSATDLSANPAPDGTAPTTDTSGQPTGSPTQPQAQPQSQPAAQQNSCGVASMTQAACDTLLSLERQGLKNNPNVAADTQQVPDKNSVTIQKSTWRLIDAANGSVEFSATIGEENYQGTGYLRDINGAWKVVNYELRQ